MEISLLVVWILVGWCGTPWPRPWPWPLPWPWPRPKPGPGPDPAPPWVLKLVGIVGAIVGGWVFTQVWPAENVDALYALSTALGAGIGTALAVDVYSLMGPRAAE